MGSQQSVQPSLRTYIVDRPIEYTTINITEAVADRLSAQSAPKSEAIEKTPAEILPTKQCHNYMPMDDHECECNSILMKSGTSTVTVDAPKRSNELEQEFKESVQNIEQYISKLKMVQENFSDDFKLCQNIIIDCYKKNFDYPLKCSKEASMFKECIVNLSFEKLNKNACR